MSTVEAKASSAAGGPAKGGVLFVFSAPSGAGKTSLVKALLARDPGLRVSVSHTTRPRRPTETDAVNYHFVERATFRTMVDAGAFLEHAEVFGNHYGTARKTVREHFATGHDVILEIDWQGAAQIRATHPDVVTVFILPPSYQTLRKRLTSRGEDSSEVVEQRLAEAAGELEHYGDFDFLVVNDRFDQALDELQAIVTAQRCRRPLAEIQLQTLLRGLLSAV